MLLQGFVFIPCIIVAVLLAKRLPESLLYSVVAWLSAATAALAGAVLGVLAIDYWHLTPTDSNAGNDLVLSAVVHVVMALVFSPLLVLYVRRQTRKQAERLRIRILE
ncbi:K+-sensing histidine kinase KdpD [Rhizobium leguminosarum]|nr:K+-sensing histidine kinase KdpD [Rhizobium leguminosarum]